jgi:hypothetical protein
MKVVISMMKHYNFDAHGMSVDAIQRYLNRLLGFIPAEIQDICVIHGYNNGTVLRDFLRSKYHHEKIVEVSDFGNGRTILRLH